MAAQPKAYVQPSEYLALERVSEAKHEYADGKIFALEVAVQPPPPIINW